ncbi:TolC family protein [Nitrosophilus alvini]|uniref:TolC family protein n=1 Tax=Nitrosophilus alvini TaxID=2714855 RepID=UPI00190B24D9|nr:TolC family protein [Nitrosophilus alvini]
MKLILLCLLSIAFLWGAQKPLEEAKDFETLKNIALKSSFHIKSLELYKSVAKKKSEILLRYKNPTFEMEASRFESETLKAENGWRAAISQPVRMFGLKEDLKALARSERSLADAGYKRSKANFIFSLEKAYTEYVYKHHMVSLLKQELEITKRLEQIAKQRFENGTGTKAKFLQASLEVANVKNTIISRENELSLAYYKLFSLSGIEEKFTLKTEFIYKFDDIPESKTVNSPDIEILRKKRDQYIKEAKLQSRLIKEIDLFAEYENEPDQSIMRAGVAIELPLFNRNKEEAQLARIKALQASFEENYLETGQSKRIESLYASLRNLKKMYEMQKELLKQETELLKLFEEGYRISKGSLLDLLDAKNRLLDTKRKLLTLQKQANSHIIELNYLQGRYYE